MLFLFPFVETRNRLQQVTNLPPCLPTYWNSPRQSNEVEPHINTKSIFIGRSFVICSQDKQHKRRLLLIVMRVIESDDRLVAKKGFIFLSYE